MRSLHLLALSLALPLLALPSSGCFDPQYGEGGFHCAPAEGKDACPDGYTCQPGNEPGEFVCRLPQVVTVSVFVVKDQLRAGDKLPIRLELTGHELAPARVGQAAVPGEGHVHVFIDAVEPLKHTWTTVTTLAADIPVPSSTTAGTHKVISVLSNNDHTLLVPRAQDEATFEVTP